MKKITLQFVFIIFTLIFGLLLLSCPKIFADTTADTTNKYLNFSKKNLTDITALSDVDLSTAETVDLSNNLFDNDDVNDLINLANTYPNANFILFFNNITTVGSHPTNLFLGVQNVVSNYLNQTPDTQYTVFDDFQPIFEMQIYFVQRLDGATPFSTSFGNDTFNQTGKYRIKIFNNEHAYYRDLSYCYAVVTSPTAKCEMGANIALNNIEIKGGLNIANFYVEITFADGQPFSTNQLGTFDIVYTIYAKSISGNKIGEALTTLSQTVTFYDTAGPVITPAEEYSYCYLYMPYVDSGATAIDVVDGECVISSIHNVNVRKIGVYQITYTAEDKSGNKSQLTKNIEVIYRPVESISLSYTQQNHYKYGSTLEFEIKVNEGKNSTFTNPERKFYIFRNGSLILETTDPKFTLQCDVYGNNQLLVLTEDKLNSGEVGRTSTQVEIAVFEGMWWDNFLIKLFFSFLLILLILDGIMTLTIKRTKGAIVYGTTRK